MNRSQLIETLTNCQSCVLHRCQSPLLDVASKADVMWVGLSAKHIVRQEPKRPLSPTTLTGGILQMIENGLGRVRFYKTNLVKCPPLDAAGRLRYPDEKEMEACSANLQFEIQVLRPAIVVLLGAQVTQFCFAKSEPKPVLPKSFDYEPSYTGKICFLPIHHPAFIAVYRRKHRLRYCHCVMQSIRSLLNR